MATPTSIPSRVSDRRWVVLWSAGYLLLYLLLDWVSYIRPLQGFNITPWNPQPALAIALLLRHPGRVWLAWLGLLLAEVVVRGMPGDWWAALVASLALSWLYAAMARALVRFLGPTPTFSTPRELAWFTAILGVGALLCGLAYVTAYAAPTLGTPMVILGAIGRYWIGDLVGLLVTLPILLFLIDPLRRHAFRQTASKHHWLLFPVLIALLVWAVLGHGGGIYLRFFYLLFIPVVLASALQGIQGAVLAATLTQLGMIVTVQGYPQPDLTLFELQALMAAITMTGLLVGVLVDERARTAEALRDSMRLATAGQMAAALAHELSQPLTALNNYAQACRALLADTPELPGKQRERLEDVMRHVAADATRASQVIKRLRDFFQSGAVQLELRTVHDVVQAALAAQRPRAVLNKVALRSELPENLPRVWLDPVQIGIVLRNLLDNALHAVGVDGGWVEVRAGCVGNDLLLEVRDSGPGVELSRLSSLFEPGASDKPGGMGIGLGICRAIIEAHGGRLWALAEGQGHFCFTLPLGEHEDEAQRNGYAGQGGIHR